MADNFIEFVIDGGAHRNGAIPADAFTAKLRLFVATIYAFEKAFTHHDGRQLDLEIVDLNRKSPARVQMYFRSRKVGYDPRPAIEWTFNQLGRLERGEKVDAAVTQIAIDNVIELASFREAKQREVTLLEARFDGATLHINETLRAQALAARAQSKIEAPTPWRAGMSRGSLFGELRGVMDIGGERKFFILPPSGPDKVECVFSEALRPAIGASLFQVVRAKGMLHYRGDSPHPFLLQAESLEGAPAPTLHLSDLTGLFKDVKPGERIEEWR